MERNKKLPNELLKGHARTLILAILSEAPAHGYAIAHEITRRTDHAIAFKQSSLYPLLHELESDGLIEGSWQMVGGDRPKKVYVITDSGREELAKKLKDWEKFASAMYQVTGVLPDKQSTEG